MTIKTTTISTSHINKILNILDRMKMHAEIWAAPLPEKTVNREDALIQATYSRCGKTILKLLKELEDN